MRHSTQVEARGQHERVDSFLPQETWASSNFIQWDILLSQLPSVLKCFHCTKDTYSLLSCQSASPGVCGKCSLWTLQVHLCIRAFFSLLSNISSCGWATCYLPIRSAWTSGFISITGLSWTILGMSVHRWTLAYNSLSCDFSTLWLYKRSTHQSNRNYIMGLGR